MKTAAATRRYPAYDPVHLLGRVVAREGDGSYRVECDGRPWRARRAASCLLAPGIGDEVLISGPDPARVYLIAVIVQADAGRARSICRAAWRWNRPTATCRWRAPARSACAAAPPCGWKPANWRCMRAMPAAWPRTSAMSPRSCSATVGTTRLVGKAYEAGHWTA